MGQRKRVKWAGFVLGLVLFAIAIYVLRRELKTFSYDDIVFYVENIPPFRMGLGFLFTCLGYLVLTGYDVLAFRYIGHPLPFNKIATASFIGYAFSHNLGLSLLTGAPVRFRLYTSWGMSGIDVARVVTFCVLTFFLGFFAVGGAVFLFEPPVLHHSLHYTFPSMRPLGLACLALVLGYIWWSWYRTTPLKFGPVTIPVPGLKLSIPQIIVSASEWILTGCVLYFLLPVEHPISFSWFLGIFLLAQLGGLLSQVPGGLGVFDSIILLGLTPGIDQTKVMGALVIYRIFFYIIPLLVAIVLLGLHELDQKKSELKEFVQAIKKRFCSRSD